MILQPPNTDEVVREVTTNLIAPNLIAQSFAPHLLALAKESEGKVKTNLFLTSSSLAYFPLAFYPTYCATKAGISAFAKIVRMQVGAAGGVVGGGMNVVEVVPPVCFVWGSFFVFLFLLLCNASGSISLPLLNYVFSLSFPFLFFPFFFLKRYITSVHSFTRSSPHPFIHSLEESSLLRGTQILDYTEMQCNGGKSLSSPI